MHRDYNLFFFLCNAYKCAHTHGCQSMNGCTVCKGFLLKNMFCTRLKKNMRSVVCVEREKERERERKLIFILRRGYIFLPLSFTYLLIFTFLLSPCHPDPIEVLHTWGVILFSCFVNGTIVRMWHAEGISQCILTVLFSHPVLLNSVSKK